VADEELSMTMPLVPPVSDAVADVSDDPVKALLMLKDMMQPEPLDGQLMGEAVTGLAVTLKKILSVLPLLNSVIGEQLARLVVRVGPSTGVPIVPALIGITQIAFTVPVVPHAYKFPVPLAEA